MQRKELINQLCIISNILTGRPTFANDPPNEPNPLLAASELGILRGLLAAEEKSARKDPGSREE